MTRMIGALAFWVALAGSTVAMAGAADDAYNAQVCRQWGVESVSWVQKWRDPTCDGRCPACLQCYSRVIRCGNWVTHEVYSQSNPSLSDAQNAAGVPRLIAEAQQRQREIATIRNWENLSPWPQLAILLCFIVPSIIGFFGNSWERNEKARTAIIGLNCYFAVALLFFNTSRVSNTLIHQIDGLLFFHSWFFPTAIVAFIIVVAKPFLVGCDFLFVKHPAADIVNSAVDAGTAIDARALASALTHMRPRSKTRCRRGITSIRQRRRAS